MKKMKGSLFVAAVCSAVLSVACSDDEVAGGAVEDSGIVAEVDTVFVHDSIFVKDTVKVKDSVKTTDTVEVVKKDTVKIAETDTVTIIEKDSVDVFRGAVSGVAQKGPFVKNSIVKIYELDGTNALRQTKRSYEDVVLDDDGSYKIRNVSLVSPYVYLTVTGTFRREVIDSKFAKEITLRAISDLEDSRTIVNVNLLTHLEYDRVVFLMGKNPKMTLSDAKRQAEAEIFKAFSIDVNEISLAENLDIFGTGDADAALLALSVMLSAGLDAEELAVRLEGMSKDLADDGDIDDEALLDSIAVNAMNLDFGGKLLAAREYMLSWGFGGVPDFEKVIRNFWPVRLGYGVCGSESVPVGTGASPNEVVLSAGSYGGAAYEDSTTRYVCVDSAGVGSVWRIVLDSEKDTLGLGSGFNEADVHAGLVNKDSLYVFDNGGFRKANRREALLKRGCTEGSAWDTLSYGYTIFECREGGWRVAYYEQGRVNDVADSALTYKTVGIGRQMWMAENVNTDLSVMFSSSSTEDTKRSACGGVHSGKPDGDCSEYGFVYTWDAANVVCPEGWRLPSKADFETLVDFVGGADSAGLFLRLADGWSYPNAPGAPTLVPGVDEFGFAAISVGEQSADGSGGSVGQATSFWSSTENGSDEAHSLYLSYSDSGVQLYSAKKGDYKSVRCVMDE